MQDHAAGRRARSAGLPSARWRDVAAVPPKVCTTRAWLRRPVRRQDLVLQTLLAQHPLQLPDLLVQSQNFGTGNTLVIGPDGLFAACAHTASPAEDQTGRNTMTTGHIGNCHSGLRRLLHHSHLLSRAVAPAPLDTGKHFDPFSIVGHSRITRPTPSLYLCGLAIPTHVGKVRVGVSFRPIVCE